jgi:ribosomal protein S8E
MKIQSIVYNWQDDQYQTVRELGKGGVVKIEVHPSQGEGDKWYWTVEFEDGHSEMIFNINTVRLYPE